MEEKKIFNDVLTKLLTACISMMCITWLVLNWVMGAYSSSPKGIALLADFSVRDIWWEMAVLVYLSAFYAVVFWIVWWVALQKDIQHKARSLSIGRLFVCLPVFWALLAAWNFQVLHSDSLLWQAIEGDSLLNTLVSSMVDITNIGGYFCLINEVLPAAFVIGAIIISKARIAGKHLVYTLWCAGVAAGCYVGICCISNTDFVKLLFAMGIGLAVFICCSVKYFRPVKDQVSIGRGWGTLLYVAAGAAMAAGLWRFGPERLHSLFASVVLDGTAQAQIHEWISRLCGEGSWLDGSFVSLETAWNILPGIGMEINPIWNLLTSSGWLDAAVYVFSVLYLLWRMFTYWRRMASGGMKIVIGSMILTMAVKTFYGIGMSFGIFPLIHAGWILPVTSFYDMILYAMLTLFALRARERIHDLQERWFTNGNN